MTRTAITRPELVAEGSDWVLIVERTLPNPRIRCGRH